MRNGVVSQVRVPHSVAQRRGMPINLSFKIFREPNTHRHTPLLERNVAPGLVKWGLRSVLRIRPNTRTAGVGGTGDLGQRNGHIILTQRAEHGEGDGFAC